jgi:hypothetical protein
MNDDNIGNRVSEERNAVITFNCTKEQKNKYVMAAKPDKLVDWILTVLDDAAADAMASKKSL